MANTGNFDSLNKIFGEALNKGIDRRLALMECDPTVKEWIKELEAEIESLKTETKALHLKLGGNCFNPVQW